LSPRDFDAGPACFEVLYCEVEVNPLTRVIYAMTSDNDKAPKTDRHTVVLSLAGIVITAGVGWWAAAHTAAMSYQQSCLARLDAKEALIRSKTDVFFGALGNLISFGTHRIKDDTELEKRIDTVAVAAYSLTSYLDGEISKTPKLIILYTMQIYIPDKTEDETKNAPKNSENLGDELDKWNDQYSKLMAKFEVDRKECY
jgi:hypothetical protein